jgi:hypothetical protein
MLLVFKTLVTHGKKMCSPEDGISVSGILTEKLEFLQQPRWVLCYL